MPEDVQVHRELDLKGEVCPYTFVKSKLILETMAPGEVLRVIVDYPPATGNVPRSMESEGHKVLAVNPAGAGVWEIIVRKKD
ncbi:MAG TPA: sulfurtransferase TusA family protein [Limnochordales bacterium]